MRYLNPLAGAAMACLLLAGCGPTILANPANKLNVGVLGKTYGAAQKIALAYDGLPFCSKAATLLCSQPKVVIAIDTADKAASLAWGDLVTATETPNVDLTDAFAAAQSAVATLQHIEKLYNAAGATS